MFKLVETKIKKSVTLVLETSKKKNITPRAAGMAIAEDRVRKAMDKRWKKETGKQKMPPSKFVEG